MGQEHSGTYLIWLQPHSGATNVPQGKQRCHSFSDASLRNTSKSKSAGLSVICVTTSRSCRKSNIVLESFTLTSKDVRDLQRCLNAQFTTLVEQYLAQQFMEPCNVPNHESKAITGARSQIILTAPYPKFDAGHRPTNTPELLEMIFTKLPDETILFAQRTNRQIRAVIAGLHLLQRWVFFTTPSITSAGYHIILNRITTKPTTLPYAPLCFDEEMSYMAYYSRRNRRRIYCTATAAFRDDTSGQQWVNLGLTKEKTLRISDVR